MRDERLQRCGMYNLSKLRVFNEAEEIALEVYRLTRGLPDEQRFGLGQQMRRAAVSIGSNIAEGCGRASRREFARFLDMALGSATELGFQLRLISRLGYAPEDECAGIAPRIVSVERMLVRLILRIRPARGASRGRPFTVHRSRARQRAPARATPNTIPARAPSTRASGATAPSP